MLTFEKIKLYFEKGLWNAQMVQKAVEKQVITAAQAAEITGEAGQNA